MTHSTVNNQEQVQELLPGADQIAKELGRVKSIDDFFGKDGVISNLFASAIEHLLQAELSDHLGYNKYAVKGRNSGNSRNGGREKTLRTSVGDQTIQIPRDRNSTFTPSILKKYENSSNEIEKKIIAMYGKGMTTSDIGDMLQDIYGVEISTGLISQITDKIMPLVEQWHNRPLQSVYVIAYLDCIHVKIRTEGRIKNVAVYSLLAVGLDGKKEILGHWVSTAGESASYWLKVITEVKNRGVEDILITCVDGLTGFKEAILAVYPQAVVQRCVIHQIRNSLKYVSWKDKKDFVVDMKLVYKANTKEEAETNLLKLSEKWSGQYGLAVKSWETNWEELSQYFNYAPEIRRIIYTTNGIEGYHRQLRKVSKTRAVFPTVDSVRKLFYLATRDIEKKWTQPIHHWEIILNQLAIHFKGRIDL